MGKRGCLAGLIVATWLLTAAPSASAAPVFSEGFESGLGQFTAAAPTNVAGATPWSSVTTDKHSGTHSAFSPDPNNLFDDQLTTTAPVAIPANTILTFFHRMSAEGSGASYFDGGVLEVSKDGGAFADVTNASIGGAFISGGYNGTINASFGNPLAGRPAWGQNIGTAGNFAPVTVNLSALAGHTASFRFRFGADNSIAATGWWVDDVTIGAGHTLNVAKAGTGAGTVTSAPSGINCGTTCSALYVDGTSVALTATPAAGSSFAGWTGCDAPSGNQCTMSMDADKTATANFLPTRTLTVTKAGGGSGSVTSSPPGIDCGATCSAGVAEGTSLTLTASPAAGSGFESWTGCDSPAGATCTMSMSADKTATANFDVPPQAYTASADSVTPNAATLAGTVNGGSGATNYQFDYGTDPSLAGASSTTAAGAPSPNDTDQAVSQGVSGLTPGTHYYYRLDATNSAGTAQGSIFSFRTTPLDSALITKHPPSVIETSKPKAKVKFVFGAAKAGVFECKLDKANYKPCTSPKTYKVQPGKHKFRVRALTAGVAGKPAKFKFKVVRK